MPQEELEDLFLEVTGGSAGVVFPDDFTGNGEALGGLRKEATEGTEAGAAADAGSDPQATETTTERPAPSPTPTRPGGLDEEELFGSVALLPPAPPPPPAAPSSRPPKPPPPRRGAGRRQPTHPDAPTMPSLAVPRDLLQVPPPGDDTVPVTDEMLDLVAEEQIEPAEAGEAQAAAVSARTPAAPHQAGPEPEPVPGALPIELAASPSRPAPPPSTRSRATTAPARSQVPSSQPSPSPAPSPSATEHAGERTPLTDHALFRQESQALARAREWHKLADITQAAIDHASWVTLPETRAALLLDLARIHRDRLSDPAGAEASFQHLAQVDPTNEDALSYLSAAYRSRGDWRAIYDLYSAAVEPTWDPNQRLAWTRETARIALEALHSPDLAIESWERLDRLGDAAELSYQALSELYRRARRWDRLAQFLGRRAAHKQGAEKVVALREVAEAYLSGLRDHEHAGEVLEQILAARPDDVLALLAYVRVAARRSDWPALAGLAERTMAGTPRPVVLDFRRGVAEALWNAGQREAASEAFQRVLEIDPVDAGALWAIERYYSEDPARAAELVEFLVARAARPELDDGARAELLARAAELADKGLDDARRSAELWERRALLPGDHLPALRALERLYDRLGELAGVGKSLEAQLALTRNLTARVELLRRLGDHSAHRVGNDERAEECWHELLSILPDDRQSLDELMALHRRRGDFEALDRALRARALRTAERREVLGYWRLAAQNIDDNLRDPRRSVTAWNRVLDVAPTDEAALAASVSHHRVLGDRPGLIRALEAQLRVTSDVGERRERGLEVAALWEQEGARVAALAAFERVLVWDPTDAKALDGVIRLGEVGSAIGALEVAAATHAAAGRAAERIALLRRSIELQGGDKPARVQVLRRILRLSGNDPAVLAELEQAAADAEDFAALVEVHGDLAENATDPSVRLHHREAMARLHERHLGDAARAYLVLQSNGLRRLESLDEVAELSRLADVTGRHEDLLALLEVSAGAEVEPALRASMRRRRASILEERLKDGGRAFAECARLLRLDPSDAQALAEARRIAEANGLWRQLDALCAERWDRADGPLERARIALERVEIHAARLSDPASALDYLAVAFRLQPDLDAQGEGLRARLRKAAAGGGWWDRVLPLLEARERAALAEAAPEALVGLGALHEHERKDPARAFELYAEAFALRPDSADVDEALRRIGEATGRQAALAASWRVAAARAGSPARQLELLRRVAHLAEEKLQDRPAALEAHHAILELDPGALPSLERVIGELRESGQWRELRMRLSQWLDQSPRAAQAPSQEARIERLLEVARVSRQHLDDLEAFLHASEQVLKLDASQPEALANLRSLEGKTEDPRLELKRLRIELPLHQGAPRAELLLACARIERGALDDPQAALATLRQLVEEAGADGPGYPPLAQLLRETSDWAALATLVEARAERLTDRDARVAALEEAVAVVEQHLPEAPLERREALFTRILAEHPGDGETRRRLLSLYRDAGRYQELAAALEAALGVPGLPADERRQHEAELVRVLALALGRDAEASERLASARTAGEAAAETESLLFRARAALSRDDFPGYLEARLAHGRRLEPTFGALVLCHLAEACDERPGQQLRVAGLYREARALDAHNPLAMEALKAIGRRARSWRATAALLPEPDEARLSFTDRSRRLVELARQALGDGGLAAAGGGGTPEGARAADLLLRAVAIDPDSYRAWDALAELRAAQGDTKAALEARTASLAAYQRSVAPSPEESREHVARMQALADACRAAGQADRAAALSLSAHRLAPNYAAAALSVADRTLDGGDVAGAHALYARVLSPPTANGLTDAERLHATYRRGALALRLGRGPDAVADLQAALAIDPLHPGVLRALGAALDSAGRIGAAATHYVQALLVEPEAARRGNLYARLGRLLEDKLGSAEEAGVCYDLSITASSQEGAGDHGERDVLLRALTHYRRQGRPERALAVIDRILPTVDDPREQATLWTERGAILSGAGDEDRAMEAFDMALSYDPGNRGAITGLSRILERRGDWEQLAQIFEARTESGSAEERAEAMRALARMALSHLGDRARAEKYLRSVVELAPTREDYEALLGIYGDDPAQREGRMMVLSGLLGFGGPFMPRVIDLGRSLVAAGDRRWAWCVLSPLMNSTLSEPALKATVLELRKEFEKSDNTAVLTPRTHLAARPAGFPVALHEVLAEIDERLTLGRARLEDSGAAGVGRLDERTAVGKNFAAMANRLGLPGTQLTRAQELPEPYLILDGEAGQVVVRAELLQLLSVAETAFLFAALLEQSRPGMRLLSSLRAEERAQLLPALYAAVDLPGHAAPDAATSEAGARLHAALREQVPEEVRAGWAARLREAGAGTDPAAELAALQQGLLETARRVGLVAAADLRFAARVITRLDDSLPKMQTVGRIDDIDEFIAGAPPVRSLLGFAVSPLFGRLLHGESQP